VSTASEGALPEPVRGVRVTDADRLHAVARLRVAAGEGAIDLDELEDRIGLAYQARNVAELARVTSDLPVTIVPPDAKKPKHRHPLVLEDDEFRGHLTTYAAVIGMLVVIWLLGGAGHPWPIYPAMGWGIGLAGHHQRALTHQRKRLARATAEGITLAELELREAEEKREQRRRKKQQRRAEGVERRAQRDEQRGRSRGGRLAPPPPGQLPRGEGASADATSSRYVVAMFVDVVGSTQLNEALGDERWAAVRRAFRTTVAEAVEGHGGWEANCSGDGILARFHEPGAAADAAVQILRRHEVQRDQTGFAPSVRIGIHSGDAVEDGDDIIGNVVNLAARVTDVAEADQIMVTEHVADHLDSRHATAGRGLHDLKGISRPRHLLALDWR
jgi:class 3 adenylate cyclase